ncbi:MAG: hypothetical protein KL863_00120 [Rhizobium sp.]|nr:hypothetical protein [Rhizobium sp.]
MATMEAILPRSATSAPVDPTSLARRVEQTMLAALGIQFAFLMPSVAAYLIDERLLYGISVWSKPIKFQLSLILLYLTLLWLLPLIDARTRGGRVARATTVVLAVATTLEIAYITLQAARGTASHFNTGTPREAMLYQLMGLGAVAIVVAAFVFGYLILRHGRAGTGDGFRLGAAAGLMLGAVLTLVTAGILASGAIDGAGHWVGGDRSDAGGLFLLGWSRTGGDLRVPHFFATHIMQALPLLGLLLDRFRPGAARTGLAIGAVLSILVVAATLLQAVSGRPFL